MFGAAATALVLIVSLCKFAFGLNLDIVQEDVAGAMIVFDYKTPRFKEEFP